MFKNRKVAVIIAAGGSGSRMGKDMPKQFLKIGGKTILEKTTEVFQKNEYTDAIGIVMKSEYINTARAMLKGFSKVVFISEGGKQRQDSVAEGLRILKEKVPDYDLVLIHDAARPFVTDEVILSCLKGADSIGAAVAAVPVKDTIKQRHLTLERKELYSVQTPQGFAREIIEKAYERAYSDGYFGTDDGSLVERLGMPVATTEGDYANIKITTKEDLPMERRIGTGYDVHELVPGRPCILGGVEIPYEKGLLGHSDADVLVHAIMDALLGAAGLGDIGRHFPDSDPAYKGISSIKLLEKVEKLLAEKGYKAVNIDAVLICQKPKIAPFVEEMKRNVARALGIDANDVNIKGTTTEGLGFTGRGEGIAAQAVSMIEGDI